MDRDDPEQAESVLGEALGLCATFTAPPSGRAASGHAHVLPDGRGSMASLSSNLQLAAELLPRLESGEIFVGHDCLHRLCNFPNRQDSHHPGVDRCWSWLTRNRNAGFPSRCGFAHRSNLLVDVSDIKTEESPHWVANLADMNCKSVERLERVEVINSRAAVPGE